MQGNSLDRSDLDQIWTHIDQHLLSVTLDLMDLPNTQSLRPGTPSIGHEQVNAVSEAGDSLDWSHAGQISEHPQRRRGCLGPVTVISLL